MDNRVNISVANGVLVSYCTLLERAIANYADPNVSKENVKELLRNAGPAIASISIYGKPPKSTYQNFMANNFEKLFQNCSGISDDDLREAISLHVQYACSNFDNGETEAENCRRNLDLNKCGNYPRFCRLRQQIEKSIPSIEPSALSWPPKVGSVKKRVAATDLRSFRDNDK